MKKSQIYNMIFLITILVIPFVSFATAATPNYVGIQEGQEIIWNTYFDDDPLEDFLEDWGLFSETFIDNWTDEFFDKEFDKDITGWKIKITEIEKEDDDDGDDYVEIDYRLYTKEEDTEWEVEDQKNSHDIWKYDEDLYVDWMYVNLFYHVIFLADIDVLPLVVADNVKWGKVADELDDELDDDFDGSDESAGADVATYMYFFTQKENGISAFFNFDEDDFEDFTMIAQFNDNGILMYYNWAYDGDTIIQLELQYRMVYQWWWAAALIAVAAIVIIIVIIIIKKR